MRRKRSFLLSSLLAGAVLAAGCGGKPSPARGVILVLVDTLRKDRVGAFGGPRELTPSLDRLAEEGFRFTRAYAPSSWTKPSVASLFTALYPARHGTVVYPKQAIRGGVPGRMTLPPKVPTLAERFREAGFSTAAFVNNPHISKANGFDRGFDTFVPTPGKAEALLEKARNWLARNGKKRFFLYLHLLDPHTPYTPPEPFRERFAPPDPGPGAPLTRRGLPVEVMLWQAAYKEWGGKKAGRAEGGQEPFRFDYEDLYRLLEKTWGTLPPDVDVEKIAHQVFLDFQGYDDPRLRARVRCLKALYDGEVAYTDAAIGRFGAFLREQGLLDETALVITADHGEGFFEHGTWWHGQGLYGEEVDIPLLLRVPGPGGAPLLGACDAPVSLADVGPTLLELAGIGPPPGVDGRSLWPVILDAGDSAPGDRTVFSDGYLLSGRYHAVIKGRWKLIRTGSETDPVRYELYDLLRDPGEGRPMDLAAAGAVGPALRGLLDARAAGPLPSARDEKARPALSKEEAERLRGLGYF